MSPTNPTPNFMEDEHFQSMLKGNANGVVFRGVTYKSFEEMPEEIRPKMKQAFDQLTQMGMINMQAYKLFAKK